MIETLERPTNTHMHDHVKIGHAEHSHEEHHEHSSEVRDAQIRAIMLYALDKAYKEKDTQKNGSKKLTEEMRQSMTDSAGSYNGLVKSLSPIQKKRFTDTFATIYPFLPEGEADHHGHHHHHHHGEDDSGAGRALLTENMYLQTHKVINSRRKLRKQQGKWADITDTKKRDAIILEIHTTEERLGQEYVGRFEKLSQIQKSLFIKHFIHERESLPELLPRKGLITRLEEALVERAKERGGDTEKTRTKAKRFTKVLAVIACQFDCTIPAALNIIGAATGGLHGDEHSHTDHGVLSNRPQYVHTAILSKEEQKKRNILTDRFEYSTSTELQGKEQAALPDNVADFVPKHIILEEVESELPDEFKSVAIQLAGEEQLRAESKPVKSLTSLERFGRMLFSKSERTRLRKEKEKEQRQQWLAQELLQDNKNENVSAQMIVEKEALRGTAWALQVLKEKQEKTDYHKHHKHTHLLESRHQHSHSHQEEEHTLQFLLTPVIAHVAFSLVDPLRVYSITSEVSLEQKKALENATVKHLDSHLETIGKMSLESRRKAYEGDVRSFAEKNAEWNNSFWQSITAMVDHNKIAENIREERLKAFASLGIDVFQEERDEASGLHIEVEEFRKKYVGSPSSNIKQFIEDISKDCRGQDGSINMKTMEMRLQAIEPLLKVFGTYKEVHLLVKDFAITHGMLSLTNGSKQAFVERATHQLAHPLTENEQRRLAFLWGGEEHVLFVNDEESDEAIDSRRVLN